MTDSAQDKGTLTETLDDAVAKGVFTGYHVGDAHSTPEGDLYIDVFLNFNPPCKEIIVALDLSPSELQQGQKCDDRPSLPCMGLRPSPVVKPGD